MGFWKPCRYCRICIYTPPSLPAKSRTMQILQDLYIHPSLPSFKIQNHVDILGFVQSPLPPFPQDPEPCRYSRICIYTPPSLPSRSRTLCIYSRICKVTPPFLPLRSRTLQIFQDLYSHPFLPSFKIQNHVDILGFVQSPLPPFLQDPEPCIYSRICIVTPPSLRSRSRTNELKQIQSSK